MNMIPSNVWKVGKYSLLTYFQPEIVAHEQQLLNYFRIFSLDSCFLILFFLFSLIFYLIYYKKCLKFNMELDRKSPLERQNLTTKV